MKKKMVIGAAALCMIGVVLGVSAAGVVQKVQSEIRSDFTIVIDGEEKHFKNANGGDVYPILYDGTTYLPVRAIGEIMGKTVYWYEDQKRIELKSETPTVTDADVIVTNTAAPEVSSQDISLEKAKEIALGKANLKAKEVVFTEAKSDYDDGVPVYDIEFFKGNTEYSAEIRVSDGYIVSWETEKKSGADKFKPKKNGADESGDIGVEKAKEIALQKAGIAAEDAVFKKAKLDYDDGVRVYKIEFKVGKTEYSADIKASDGTVIDWEID